MQHGFGQKQQAQAQAPFVPSQMQRAGQPQLSPQQRNAQLRQQQVQQAQQRAQHPQQHQHQQLLQAQHAQAQAQIQARHAQAQAQAQAHAQARVVQGQVQHQPQVRTQLQPKIHPAPNPHLQRMAQMQQLRGITNAKPLAQMPHLQRMQMQHPHQQKAAAFQQQLARQQQQQQQRGVYPTPATPQQQRLIQLQQQQRMQRPQPQHQQRSPRQLNRSPLRQASQGMPSQYPYPRPGYQQYPPQQGYYSQYQPQGYQQPFYAQQAPQYGQYGYQDPNANPNWYGRGYVGHAAQSYYGGYAHHEQAHVAAREVDVSASASNTSPKKDNSLQYLPCKFHGSAAGCRYGKDCEYSHQTPKTVPLCIPFHSQSSCEFSDKCYHRHVTVPEVKQHNLDPLTYDVPRKFFTMSGKCSTGNSCRFRHIGDRAANMEEASGTEFNLVYCMFYNTAEGCKYGFNCRFYHDPSKSGNANTNTNTNVPQMHFTRPAPATAVPRTAVAVTAAVAAPTAAVPTNASLHDATQTQETVASATPASALVESKTKTNTNSNLDVDQKSNGQYVNLLQQLSQLDMNAAAGQNRNPMPNAAYNAESKQTQPEPASGGKQQEDILDID